MSEPLVSIFTPTYNQRRFVHEALCCALEQDYDNLEVVVGDDGSSDGTADVILEFAKRYPKRLIPLVGGEHLGITGNCNRTLRACKGKYIAFHAGDDVLLPGKIAKQVAWMEEDDQRVLCGHDVEYFDSNTGQRVWVSHPRRRGRGADLWVKYGVLFTGNSIMVRASAIPSYGYDERLKVASDWKLWIDCLAGGGLFGYVNGVYARHRVSEHSVTRTRKREILRERLATLALVEIQYPELARFCHIPRARAFYDLGIFGMKQQNYISARLMFLESLRSSLFFSWKVPIALLLTFFPAWSHPFLADELFPRTLSDFWRIFRSRL